MSNEFTTDDARATAERITDRLQNDEGFRDAVTADPRGALEGAGVPSDVVGDFLDALVGSSEVSGYRSNVFQSFLPVAAPVAALGTAGPSHEPPATMTQKCWCDTLFKSKPIVIK